MKIIMCYVLFAILTIIVGYKLELFNKENKLDDLTTYEMVR